MVSIGDIIRSNADTFFDHRLQKRESTRPRMALQAILSLILCFCFYRGLSPFLGGVITVQAILIGFSFSAMFFLMSSNSDATKDTTEAEISLEQINAKNQTAKVAEEIFSNIAYFNLTCLVCLGVALSLMLPPISSAIGPLFKHAPKGLEIISLTLHYAGYAIWIATTWVFYFLVLESAYTFFRITSRMNFLFGQKTRAA